ncbi:hypothetical protein Cfor_05447 [Coptotermes formosanus]|uniref:Uncharacterized protein n=1 Tax=Coptotermes formosanus TaxID=36987 RepID=A0A6L2PWV4_COPFO|nr:hypothetical protein Cfor_05447 [Coptotermes formosanus]
MVGEVIEMCLPYKAVVAFQYKGKQERALLKADKVVVDGVTVPIGVSIDTYLHKGSMVKFSCHGFDETGQEQCGYFVTVAWRQDPVDLCSSNSDINASVFVGIYNASGTVSEVSHRQGVITYVDANECEHSVLFLASKLFLFGKRLNTKQNLQMALAADDKVQFDAVPCEPSENNSSCPWFATLVWKGKRPSIDYDAAVAPGVEPRNFVADIKHLVYNPKSAFIRGVGQILHILNDQFGIALAARQPNNWESILFHRSSCFLFKLNLGSHDLTKIFKEGDKIRFIAARAPQHLITQWVASQITVFVSKELEFNF